MFPGGNLKISNVLKISARLRGVPLDLRYQGISIILICQSFFHQSGMAQAGPKKLKTNLFQPQLYQLTKASAKAG